MRFDDRLATVLRQAVSGRTIARIQYRQLLDLLGTCPSSAQSEQIDAAYLRLAELSKAIPAPQRAEMLRDSTLRLRSPRLLAQLSEAEPAVASAAISTAQLREDEWLDLIPALPVRARGFVRNGQSLGPRADALLNRLGISDRGLPPVTLEVPEAEPEVEPAAAEAPETVQAAEPLELSEPAPEPGGEIGAIVKRIEEYRKTRKHEELALPQGLAPRLPLDDIAEEALHAQVDSFDFATDGEGRIVWADRAIAPMAVGLNIAARDAGSPLQSAAGLAAVIGYRQPVRAATVTIEGAPAIAGEWQLDAAPRFDPTGGHFIGYCGRMRRPIPAEVEEAESTQAENEADRMRQILHELRTPVNAIQGFAEVIHQQLFGPTPHEYRALAASIAADSAHMLAGFEELDRLVKLNSGALELDPGECDLARVIATTVGQLEAYTGPRNSGFELEQSDEPLPVAMAEIEAERLLWRLLATLAGATVPGETLKLRSRLRGGSARVTVRLPSGLADLDDDALFRAVTQAKPKALSAGMFGIGFALRLAEAEADAAGGRLLRKGDKLRLELPGLTEAVRGHSQGQVS